MRELLKNFKAQDNKAKFQTGNPQEKPDHVKTEDDFMYLIAEV